MGEVYTLKTLFLLNEWRDLSIDKKTKKKTRKLSLVQGKRRSKDYRCIEYTSGKLLIRPLTYTIIRLFKPIAPSSSCSWPLDACIFLTILYEIQNLITNYFNCRRIQICEQTNWLLFSVFYRWIERVLEWAVLEIHIIGSYLLQARFRNT